MPSGALGEEDKAFIARLSTASEVTHAPSAAIAGPAVTTHSPQQSTSPAANKTTQQTTTAKTRSQAAANIDVKRYGQRGGGESKQQSTGTRIQDVVARLLFVLH